MAYSKIEQETLIHFDVETGETSIYTNYAPDIQHYLKVAEDGGIRITQKEFEDGRVISLSGIMLDTYKMSRKPRKKRVYSEEERDIMRKRLAQYRQ